MRRGELTAALWMLVLAATIVLTMIMAGCPHPTPQRVSIPDLDELPACPAGTSPGPDDVCDGLVTATGLQCVACPGASGCIDKHDMVYCVVAQGCLIDRLCSRELPGAARRKR